jgi:hypothetical protein
MLLPPAGRSAERQEDTKPELPRGETHSLLHRLTPEPTARKGLRIALLTPDAQISAAPPLWHQPPAKSLQLPSQKINSFRSIQFSTIYIWTQRRRLDMRQRQNKGRKKSRGEPLLFSS